MRWVLFYAFLSLLPIYSTFGQDQLKRIESEVDSLRLLVAIIETKIDSLSVLTDQFQPPNGQAYKTTLNDEAEFWEDTTPEGKSFGVLPEYTQVTVVGWADYMARVEVDGQIGYISLVSIKNLSVARASLICE